VEAEINGILIKLVQGDITDATTTAIVNAANKQLILGSGVAGAIREKGGPTIQQECSEIGWCDVGNAVITSGGNLPARYVIHAVGPRLGEGNEPGKLASATRASLTLAEKQGLSSIALPAISTGIFGFPLEACAQIMIRVAIDETFEGYRNLRQIVFCLFDERAYAAFAKEFRLQTDDLEGGL
jgi:O-acetyl-ADP-ribose deacetylase (regulator of RNase III)